MGNWPEDIRKLRDLCRFARYIISQGDCIIWTGQLNKDGYGKFTTTVYPKIQSHHLAHRWIYQQAFPQLTKDQLVLHICDNPACVKLEHLYIGNEKQNSKDMMDRDRGVGQFQNGENHPSAKLTESQVIEIRKLRLEGKTHKEIASLFCLTRETVRDICNKKRWRHIK